MPRRRYRLFTVCAVVIIFLLYRVLQNTWGDSSHYASLHFPSSPQSPAAAAPPANNAPATDGLPRKEATPQSSLADEEKKKPAGISKPQPEQGQNKDGDKAVSIAKPKPNAEIPFDKGIPSKDADEDVGVKIPKLKDIGDDEGKSKPPTKPPSIQDDLANLKPQEGEKSNSQDGTDEIMTDIHWKNPPNGLEGQQTPADTRIHWVPVTEHFPVPTQSLISLPTGKPKPIPKIQHEFGIESPEAKTKRINRQEKVRKEIERAWGGYKRFAWMHDELSPVSSKYRDPFCGWAATLVDSLDTLWISGLKDEFDQAAKAVKDIDFTFTPRHSIPVFETTIRYLGGLLGAFDVSGGHDGGYPQLLVKAVELAEILMGIFDTPNRMPVLYYQWKPEFASQPHRATTVGVAELATLSLEFTRLAQLTSENKYYDAVARITNALVDLQKEGTVIPGLFPENLDASGCNNTATSIRNSLSREAQKQMDSVNLADEPQGFVPGKTTEEGSEGYKTHPEELKKKLGEFGLGKSYADGVDIKRGQPPVEPSLKHVVNRRDTAPASDGSLSQTSQVPRIKPSRQKPPFAADGSMFEWDCVAQGLVPSGHLYQNFHMGGGQDSAYEYFPKEYLLLGGLEDKYQKLHEDTIDAVNEWLLYRPMTNDDWDIMFTAKASTGGDPKNDLDATFEITHLTCFIGGMYGLGGKIFGREKDIEIAKKLTNGCVWAYHITASGIMPEGSHVLPCPTLEKCEFNQTLWWEKLDPASEWRDEQVKIWEEQKRELESEQAKSSMYKDDDSRKPTVNEEKAKFDAAEALKNSAEEYSAKSSEQEGSDHSSTSHDTASGDSKSIHKRAAVPPNGQKSSATEDLNPGSELPASLRQKIGMKAEDRELSEVSPGSNDIKTPSKVSEEKTSQQPSDPNDQRSPDSIDSVLEANRLPPVQVALPHRPQSHEEYVKERIKSSGLPPGFVSMPSRQYILRPEAIESVWYMYRITGDPVWMEKGWAMFESTIRATRTEIANSAVDDVTSDEPGLKDEMESFWLAETLKYYYLLFSEPSVISLDEWVLNTEAHPFKRPSMYKV